MGNNNSVLELSEVGYVERIRIGRYDEEGREDEEAMQRNIQKLNDCLNGCPKGRIIGKDQGFKIIRMGEHSIVAQSVSYHVGFRRKPQNL